MLTATQAGRLTFTVEDLPKLYETGLLDADARVELLNGELYLMSPIHYPHAYCVNVLTNFFGKQLPDTYWVATQNPIYLNEQTLPEPDLVIYEREGLEALRRHPSADMARLLVEVSDTTYQKDRKEKLPLYAQSGVSLVWIVNLAERAVEIYEQPAKNQYTSSTIYPEDQSLPTPFGFSLEVKALFLPEKGD